MDVAPLPDWLVDLLPAAARGAVHAALRGGEPVRATALAPLARTLALSFAARAIDRPLLVVPPEDSDARRLANDLERVLGGEPPVLRLPALDADPYRGMPAHPSVAAQRVSTLDRLARADGGPLVVVVPVAALLTPVPEAAAIRRWAREIHRGAAAPLDALAREVVAAGYRVVDVVGGPGDFGRRGGLFDIWPPQEDAPLRVELFGDEVDTVRRFDAGTQRTIGPVPGFRLLPAREAPIGDRES